MRFEGGLRRLVSLREEGATLLLAMLLVADGVFILLHCIWATTPLLANELFALSKDQGYAELFQYLKACWVSLLLLTVWMRTREAGYLPWAALFAWILVDDALSVHEHAGSIAAYHLGFRPLLGLRALDQGELLITSLAGGGLLAITALFYARGTLHFRRASADLALLVVLLGIFGVGFDMISVPLGMAENLVMVVLEDGGEMVALSIVAWYAFLLRLRGGDVGGSLVRAVLGRDLHSAEESNSP